MRSVCRALVIGARPKTLGASIVPVLTGTVLAYEVSPVKLAHACICALFALLIQIATNYANDYYDFLKGADTAERIGPTRMVAGGLLSPAGARNAFAFALLAACGAGVLLIGVRGPELVLLGVSSAAFAILYTGGPYPLAYLGLGDLFVVMFFGWIATGGTYYVLTGAVSVPVLLAGTAVGLLAVMLLVINNIRDECSDRKAQKKTLIVRFGRNFGEGEYQFCLWAASILFVCSGILIGHGLAGFAAAALLFFLSLKVNAALPHARTGPEFNILLAQTAKLVLLVPLAFSLAILLGDAIYFLQA